MVEKVDWDSLSSIFNRMNQSPGYYMMQVVQKWDRGIGDILDGYDTTRPQLELMTCMAKLMKDGKPVTQKDLADFIRRDKNTVSEILRNLEKKGYVTRSAGEHDMRAKHIALTDKGFHLVEKAAGEVMQFDERFFPDDEETRELKKRLAKYF